MGQGRTRRQQRGPGVDTARSDHAGQVGAQQARDDHSAIHVEQSRALLQQVAGDHRLRGKLQDRLDQWWCQARVGLEHLGHGPGHHWGCHRGARKIFQTLVGGLAVAAQARSQRRVVGSQRVQAAAHGGRSTDHFVARRHQIGLEQVVNVAQAQCIGVAAAGGPARAEAVDHVIVARHGGLGVGGAHRDDCRIVAG